VLSIGNIIDFKLYKPKALQESFQFRAGLLMKFCNIETIGRLQFIWNLWKKTNYIENAGSLWNFNEFSKQ